MYSEVNTAIVYGIESMSVCVEADVGDGLPVFEMVGFLSSEVKEAKERVRIALKNSGFSLPPKRITINLSPANLKKSGTGFDLPIAIAVLSALGIVEAKGLTETLVVGEIGLNGQILPVNGILSMMDMAKKRGMKRCLVPEGNYEEACLVNGIEIVPLQTIEKTVKGLNEGCFEKETHIVVQKTPELFTEEMDFGEINGQEAMKRACEIAVAGMHNLLMIGPPGAGKTMVARRIPTILPPIDEKEQMELSKIYSVSGLLKDKKSLMDKRPFRMPHHTISQYGLAGGGTIPKPGEISLAHSGVLFLDEFPEFQKATLEVLRQPMEDKKVSIVRVQGNVEYPADFMLVAAMNPCKCGFYPDMNKCTCTDVAIDRYLSGISQPLLDRIDICVEAPRLSYAELIEKNENETSEMIRARVVRVHELQKKRFEGTSIRYNAQIPSSKINQYCQVNGEEAEFMKQIFANLNLSARAYYKILKVARTIADLEESEKITMEHLSEAVCYRSIDKKFWKRRAYDL